MSIVERTSNFFLGRRLDKQINRIEAVEDKMREKGYITLPLSEFRELPIRPGEEGTERETGVANESLEAIEGASDGELEKMPNILGVPLTKSVLSDWKYLLQLRKSKL